MRMRARPFLARACLALSLLAVCLPSSGKARAAPGPQEQRGMAVARSLLAEGRYEEARALLEPLAAGMAGAEERAEARYWLALLEPVGEIAEIRLSELVQEFPASPFTAQALLRLAIGRHLAGEFPRADYYLRKILEDFPATPLEPEMHLWLGRNYLVWGDPRSALAEIRRGQAALPASGAAGSTLRGALLFEAGEALQAVGDLQGAVAEWRALVELPGEHCLDVLAWGRLAEAYGKLRDEGRAREAEKAFREGSRGTILASRVEERAAPGLPPAPAGGRATRSRPQIWLQLGAFRERENAEELQRLLEGRGYRAMIAQAAVGEITLYRVRLGPFTSREEALRVQGELRARGFTGEIVEGE